MSKQQMNSADAAWLHMDRPTNLMVVNAVLWFDEPLDYKRVRDVLGERLAGVFPRFRQRIVEPRFGVGVPSWEDDPNFDLDHHVHHIGLPAPGDRGALQELVGDLISSPMDRSKALWDFYIVDGYGAGTAGVARIHHSISDGIALVRVLISMTDEQPDASFHPAAQDKATRGRLDVLARPVNVGAHLAGATVQGGFELLTHPVPQLRGLASRTAADARAVSKLLLTPSDPKTVLRGELGVAQRAVWTSGVALADVKAIGSACGVTVNDVMIAAITGALRDYLVERDSLVEEIRAMIPFNLRPIDEPLPRELGNRFGLVYLSLPVGVQDPRERLDAVHARMSAIKRSPEGALDYGVLGAIGLTPPQVEQKLVEQFSSKTSLVLTNVPGPREPVYFAGTRIAGIVVWAPGAGSIGMGISVLSYGDTVTVGVRVDAGLVPDPQRIIDAFEHEFKLLKQLHPSSTPQRT